MTESRFDIAIIGGGASGVSAAVAAAREGLRVCLIDRNPIIGGLATNAEVGTICGLYLFDQSKRYSFNIGAFAREFAMELQVRSGKIPQSDFTGLKYLPYVPQDFQMICNELLIEEKVETIEGEVISLNKEESRICEITVQTKSEVRTVQLDAIIDATGVSRISKLAGLPLIETEFRQSASQVFTLANISIQDERNLSLVLLKAMRKGVLSGLLSEMEDRLYLVPGSLENGKVSLKITVPAPLEKSFSKAELRKTAIDAINHIIEYLKINEKAFREVELDSIAPNVGVRVGDRAIGKYILQEEDVLKGRHFKSSIARGNWPMEIWSQAKKVEIHPLPEGSYYEIPAETLISNELENLFFAGRCISASDKAIASARVIGTCLQTGYASGKIAAYFTEGKSLDMAVLDVQKEQFNV